MAEAYTIMTYLPLGAWHIKCALNLSADRQTACSAERVISTHSLNVSQYVIGVYELLYCFDKENQVFTFLNCN